MIDFTLSPEQLQLRETAARLAADVYGPKAMEWDGANTPLPDYERKRLAGLGFLGMGLPEEFGGGSTALIDSLIVIEELAKRCQVAAFQVFEANTGASRVIELYGSEEQKIRYLPPVIAGEKTIAVAMSEPDAGSAATDMSTIAVPDRDGYVINGVKRWCSGAGHAEQYLTYVRFGDIKGSRGIGAVVIDREETGLTFGPPERLMGFRGIPSADIFFNDVRVSEESVIIPAGGFKQLFTAFSIERLGNSTMSLAIGQACLDRTARYVQERRQFGKELVEFQLVQAAIADMVMRVEAARLLVYRAAARAGRAAPDPLEASIAKCFANEMAKSVSETAIQLHGGNGYSVEYELERYHRDALGWSLGGGTTNMQRLRIASEYLGRRFDQRS